MKNFFKTAWEIIKDFATNNWPMKIISLVFAFIVWCSVVAGTNPERMKVVENVPLQVEGVEELEAKGLCIDSLLTEIPKSVTVSVKAGVDYHRLINNSTITAKINLSSVNEAGEAKLDVYCSVGVGNSTITATNPSSVTLSIDQLASKTIPVSAKLADETKDGYYVSSIEVLNDEITVSGPKNKIDKIASGVANINVSDITESKKLSAPVTLLDNDGNELNGILTNENKLYTIVNVNILPTKDISVSLKDLQNAIINIAPDYEVYGVVSTPSIVTIAGEQDTIDAVSELSFDIIDAQGADKSVVLDAQLKDVNGVTYVSGKTLRIYVQIREKSDTLTYENQKIEVRNISEGYTAYIRASQRCDVSVTGPLSALKKISSDSIRLYVDAYGLEEGTFKRNVKIDGIAGINSEDIELSEQEVTIVVKKE